MPAKNISGRLSSRANHTGGRAPLGRTSFSEKLVKGTTQRLSRPSQRCQCLEAVLRMFVVPASGSMRRSSLKSTGLPFASSFAARFLALSISARLRAWV
jgi:hypothetical protein